MYRFSRSLFMELKDLIDPHPDTVSPIEARRQLLIACEETIERLARDPRYFARPSRSLFDEVRHLFPLAQHARVFYAIDHVVALARDFVRDEQERLSACNAICRATTRKGKACQRTPLPGREYCPSHSHLEEIVPAGITA